MRLARPAIWLAAFCLALGAASAQTAWPVKPLRIILS
jgi:hypothetical protein